MKKCIVCLIALISINLVSAQTFLRATGMILGTKNEYTSTVTWGEAQPVYILIKVDESKVTIYSKVTQVYRKINVTNSSSTSSTWYASDNTGNMCNVDVFSSESSPGSVFIRVEYSDMTWMYITNFE